jgi:hypothetical protein
MDASELLDSFCDDNSLAEEDVLNLLVELRNQPGLLDEAIDYLESVAYEEEE